ncbi:hypothetical protein A3B42_03195 [Candidatus Daviesbacteria bacterium RIFCSPLOWO2_01_FULL_38_10]|nr:MAG: hypothetical protein US80_C0001G0017 [Candidatus Daviesbacteria bacterium GW2011_GWA2_38_17]OGE26821.1 MAG: hypothetical protein A3D02_03875 [Candidatus Daviesbacteria bacterium RIFCSPHIGHO2_02_FULL_39_41]OGE38786.1 MAG: hypothetical protein A3B42_03195 [Candidatus Daviesbacteria bacterium RIFCSPLOWO2_01_FULL_38_10]OGE44971.1 MAG: hypothetical protein A3E67_02295 [Candidatus Daviesbacteria bacterium RIFCSPHIGHO2_12_FULL_38_25]OGE68444.1 MAG: hypothetical protein A3H81_05805 [Candidatus 
MNYFIIGNLDKEQLDGLAKLMFDLAKASFILAIFPSALTEDLTIKLFKILLGLFWGLVCTYLALLLLKMKGKSL